MCMFTYSPFINIDTRGGPEKPEFIYKNCVFILTYLNFSHFKLLSI